MGEKIRQELNEDSVKEIHEDRLIGGSGNGFSLKFPLRVETRSGMIFLTSQMCWLNDMKDAPRKESLLAGRRQPRLNNALMQG